MDAHNVSSASNVFKQETAKSHVNLWYFPIFLDNDRFLIWTKSYSRFSEYDFKGTLVVSNCIIIGMANIATSNNMHTECMLYCKIRLAKHTEFTIYALVDIILAIPHGECTASIPLFHVTYFSTKYFPQCICNANIHSSYSYFVHLKYYQKRSYWKV